MRRDDLEAVIRRLRDAGCVFAEDEAALLLSSSASSIDLEQMLARRVAGEPLELIVGFAEFCGLRILVEPGVFVPRRRTEWLVTQAVYLARRGDVVVDMCCGTGAIGVAIAAAVDGVELHSTDVEPAAVRCARRNVAPIGGHVYEGDLFEPLPPHLVGRVDLLVANAPYVPTDEIAMMPSEARDHEARMALDGGADGLDIQRRVTARARHWLAPRGHLLVESSARQAPTSAALMAAAGLVPRIVADDDLAATVVIGAAGGPPTV